MSEIEKLKALYFDVKHGFLSYSKLVKKAHKKKINLTAKQIKEWLDKQKVSQIFKQSKKKEYYSITAPTVGKIVVDLLDLSNYSHENQGYRYLLNFIDIYSRYVWSFPLKSKTPDEIVSYFVKVIKDIQKIYPDNIITITTDDGSEWKGIVKELLDKTNIPHYIANPNENTKRRTSHIESFNRTILNLLKRYWASNNNFEYISVLPSFIRNYNKTKHRITNLKPRDLWKGKYVLEPMKKTKINDTLELGNYVRHSIEGDTFTKKGREPKYSDKVYQIIWREGVRYVLQEPNTLDILETLYLPRQLQKVSKENVEENKNDLFAENKAISRENRKNKETAKELDLDIDNSKKKIKVVIKKTDKPKREAKPTKKFLESIEQSKR